MFNWLVENLGFFLLHFLQWGSLNFTWFQFLNFPLSIYKLLVAFKHFGLWVLFFMKRRELLDILLPSFLNNIVVRGTWIILWNRMNIDFILLKSLVAIILLSYELSALLFEHFNVFNFICFLFIWIVYEVYILEFQVALGWWTIRIIVFTFERSVLILFRWVFLHKILYIHVILLLDFLIFVFIIFLFYVMIMIY